MQRIQALGGGSFVAWLLAGLTPCLHAEGPPQDDLAEVARVVEGLVREAVRDGAARHVDALVGLGPDVLVRVTDGAAPEQDAPHRVGGLAPSIASVGVLLLADRGALGLRDELVRHFPELEEFPGVRVEHLLSHTSGLPDVAGFLGEEAPDGRRVVEWLQGRAPEFEPGSCFDFGLTNVALTAALIERVTGGPAERFLATDVLRVDDLPATSWRIGAPAVEGVAGHELPGGLAECADLARTLSASGLRSKADDLFAWSRSLCAGGLLEERSLRTLEQGFRLRDGSVSSFGCGAQVTRLGEHAGFAMGGALGGERVHLAHYPDFELTIVLLAEGESAPLRALERSMARVVLDLDDPRVRDLPLAEDELERYPGEYYIGCTRILVRTAEDGEHLSVLFPDERAFELLYQGRHAFVSAEDDQVRLRFEFDGEKAVAFVLRERGAETRAERMR